MATSTAIQIALPLTLTYMVILGGDSKRKPAFGTVILAATNIVVLFLGMTYFADRLPWQLTWSLVWITMAATFGFIIVDKRRPMNHL